MGEPGAGLLWEGGVIGHGAAGAGPAAHRHIRQAYKADIQGRHIRQTYKAGI